MYKKVNPSLLKTNGGRFERRRASLFKALSLPRQMFKGKSIIDLGGGTGEKLFFYSSLGCVNCTLVEPNEISVNYAKKLFRKTPLKTINTPLEDFEMSTIKQYDIVSCEGVIHHLKNPESILKKILHNLGKNAMFIFAVNESNAWYLRHLQRLFVRTYGNNDEKLMIVVAKKYLANHLRLAVRKGLRSQKAVIYDTFVNPRINTLDLEAICKIFKSKNMSYHSSYPTLRNPFSLIQHSEPKPDEFDYEKNRVYYQKLEVIWKGGGKNLGGLEKRIKNKNLTRNDLKKIQTGYLGHGLSYFVGVKSE
jgi:2-polyprenyl-3-methyl-5-hydroxy-6-metoxy-1,4-benzoquinol methylase